MLKSYFNNTSHQQVLTFLANHPDRPFFDKEVRIAAKLSAGATNKALRELSKAGYIQKERKGRMFFYSVDLSNPLVRQFKILLNITLIYPLVQKLQEKSARIVLFGSSAQGTNLEQSDIDLFILTNNSNELQRIINRDKLAEKIQLVSKKPVDFAALKKKDSLFYEEVERGIILWETK